jgi:hypothetical protein
MERSIFVNHIDTSSVMKSTWAIDHSFCRLLWNAAIHRYFTTQE